MPQCCILMICNRWQQLRSEEEAQKVGQPACVSACVPVCLYVAVVVAVAVVVVVATVDVDLYCHAF